MNSEALVELLLGPMLHLIGLLVAGIWAYHHFKNAMETQMVALGGRVDRVTDSVKVTNDKLDLLWNKEHEQLRLQVVEMDRRLREVEKRKAA